MTCERCGKEHDGTFGSGRFCSKGCANSRQFSEESRQLKSQKQKEVINRVGLSNEFRNRISYDFSQEDKEKGLRKSAEVRQREVRLWQDDILENGATWREVSPRWATLRKRLIIEIGHCEICGQPPIWNGKPLSLQLDHIDGDLDNNKRSNLRVVCLHCHSQTPFYGSKNKGRGRYLRNKKISHSDD